MQHQDIGILSPTLLHTHHVSRALQIDRVLIRLQEAIFQAVIRLQETIHREQILHLTVQVKEVLLQHLAQEVLQVVHQADQEEAHHRARLVNLYCIV